MKQLDLPKENTWGFFSVARLDDPVPSIGGWMIVWVPSIRIREVTPRVISEDETLETMAS
jgi:hypothetical protein